MNNNLKIILFVALAVLLSGCSLLPTGSSQTAIKYDGGVWRSNDGGKIFAQANDVLATKGKSQTLANININKLAIDPQDGQSIYLATESAGLVYSLDGGNSWQQFSTLNKGDIRSVAVDPLNKCIFYALAGNKLFKSENCGRDIVNIYYHQKSQVILTAIAVNPKTPSIIYLGTSEGEVLKSLDGGHAWATVVRESSDRIMDLIVDPYDPNIIYAGTAKSGILKSVDGGLSWNDLGMGLKSYTGSHQYRQLVYDSAVKNSLILVSKFGLLRTFDGGGSWRVVELLPAHKTVNILALAVNPIDSNEFYYATASSLVKTTDGGTKWSSKQLPFKRTITGIYLNPENASQVFLTTKSEQN